MRLVGWLSLLCSAAVWADQPAPLGAAEWQKQGSTLRLSCPQKPSAVYFRRAPERLVVEFSGTRLDGSQPAAPSLPGVVGVHWKQPDISHAVCEVELGYRLPHSALRWTGDSLELDLDYAWEDKFRLSPAVLWTRREQAQRGRYLLWNELSLDPSDPSLELQIGLAKDRVDSRERTSEMIKRTGSLAGVNGGYFASAGGPLGVVVRDGKLVSPHVGRRPPRTTLGVMKDRRIEMDQVVAQKGTLASRSGQTWDDVQLALGGGPRLLRRGRVALTTNEEELGPNGNDITRSCARTAVATTKDGRILIATASGHRDNHLEGVRLEELAGELLRRGGSEAMNLDGGASTTMAVGDEVVSLGPGAPRAEKPVATALLVRDTRADTHPYRVELRCSDREVPANGTARVDLEVRVTDASGKPVPDDTPVRLYAERMKFSKTQLATQGGRVQVQALALAAPGTAAIRAECAGVRDQVEVKLQAGSPARLFTLVQPIAGTPGKFVLTAQAVDGAGCPVKGVALSVSEDVRPGVSGANGQSSFEIFRPVGSGPTRVTVQVENGPSTIAEIPAVAAPPSPSPSPTPKP
jgi:exopolysaccharide biosynthesis protein